MLATFMLQLSRSDVSSSLHLQPLLAEMPGGREGRQTSELAVHVVLYGEPGDTSLLLLKGCLST
jgi:hypothetical protein